MPFPPNPSSLSFWGGEGGQGGIPSLPSQTGEWSGEGGMKSEEREEMNELCGEELDFFEPHWCQEGFPLLGRWQWAEERKGLFVKALGDQESIPGFATEPSGQARSSPFAFSSVSYRGLKHPFLPISFQPGMGFAALLWYVAWGGGFGLGED